MITIRQIAYALAVEQERHFKNAAEHCAVSQSALSTGISELESQLGFQIFERNSKQVLITSLGRQFLDKAANIKREIDALEQLALLQKEPLSYPLALGVIPTIGPYLLPKVLPEVRRLYPESQLHIIEEQSHVLLEMLREGELDIAIIALPYPTDGLHAFEFWEEDFYIVVHESDAHALQREISSKELQGNRLLLLNEGHCLTDHVLSVCDMHNERTDNMLSSTSLYTLIQMVAGRMGATMVPQMALDQLLNQASELKAIHLKEPGPHRRIAFVTRLNYAGAANIEALRGIFQQQLKKYCIADTLKK